jgi:N-acetylmuramoyl-L-alanine amidase
MCYNIGLKMFYRFIFIFIFAFINLFAQSKEANSYKANIFKKPLIILDAGHGGLDRGAKIKNPYVEEKKLTLSAIRFTKKYLEQLGYKVVLTRAKDYYVPLTKRVELANNSNGEIFVSVHFNSCPNKTAHGIEIYFFNSTENKSRTKNSKSLATCVLSDICKSTNAKSRGIKKGQFCVIRETKMPAILIEAGFLTNPEERSNIRKLPYIEKISLGIVQGIENFIKKHS